MIRTLTVVALLFVVLLAGTVQASEKGALHRFEYSD